ncbi:hypothetical protein D3C78_1599470 [compost metagenome]
MFDQVLGAQWALDDKVQRCRQQQAHVGPQATEVVGAAFAPEDEVQRIADGDQQGFPGETAVLVQLVGNAGCGTGHRQLLQA